MQDAVYMSDSEVIIILVTFHINQYRNLKHYYITHIQKHCRHDFPQTVSCNRFIELHGIHLTTKNEEFFNVIIQIRYCLEKGL